MVKKNTDQNIAKRIEIIFENCEVASIEADMINYLLFDDIKETIAKDTALTIRKYKTIGSFYMALNSKADIIYDSFGGRSDQTLFKRIQKHADITGIALVYGDGHEERLSVTWTGDSEYSNDAQRTCTLPNHGLAVVISEEPIETEQGAI